MHRIFTVNLKVQ